MITVDKTSPKPLYLQVFDSCRKEILSGTLHTGAKLPALRTLALDLGVSRNTTVEMAYRQLVQEGYVSSRPGAGYIVEELDLDEMLLAWQQTDEQPEAEAAAAPHEPGARRVHSSDGLDALCAAYPIAYDFTYGDLPDESFPAELWRKLTSEALFGPEAAQASRYGEDHGDRTLRTEIARRLAVARGVRCRPDQVIVQAGTQPALMKLARLFDAARDVVAMENPGFDGARIVFEEEGFAVEELAVDENGAWDIDALEASRAKLAFVTPSSQFPTGAVMTLATRQRLLSWAANRDAYIIEDDYCREFRYNALPLPALQSLDPHGRVVYMGTFSKALSPAVRMNYLVLPDGLLKRWNRVFAGFRNDVPWLSQAVVRALLQQGHWDRLLKRAQTRNKRKHAALTQALQKHLGRRIRIVQGGAGLHLLVATDDGRDQEELVEQAARAGVRVYGTRQYWMQGTETGEHVLVGFSRIDEADIEPGVRALARAWFPDGA